jgi:hypothetical protein
MKQIYLKIAHHHGELSSLYAQLAAEGGTPTVETPAHTKEVLCHCGQPTLYQSGKNPETGKEWARHVCAKPKSSPQNCGFKKWVD